MSANRNQQQQVDASTAVQRLTDTLELLHADLNLLREEHNDRLTFDRQMLLALRTQHATEVTALRQQCNDMTGLRDSVAKELRMAEDVYREDMTKQLELTQSAKVELQQVKDELIDEQAMVQSLKLNLRGLQTKYLALLNKK